MRRLKLLIAIFASILFVLNSQPHPQAAEGVDLTTSPLPVNLTTKPGVPISTVLKIRNNTVGTQRIKMSLMKFTATGETGSIILKDREPGDDYFGWVTFSPDVIEAPTGQWVSTTMTINPPETSAFGYYYAVVFTPENTQPTGEGNVLLGSSAIMVLLEVESPNAKRSLEITDFRVLKSSYEFLPATFSLTLHNNGNVHVVPHGDILIKQGSKQIANIVFNGGQGNVLPGTKRVFTAYWDDGFPVYTPKLIDGKEVVKDNEKEMQLKWDFSQIQRLRFGQYTADLTVIYDDGHGQDIPLQASVKFWMIPWRVIGGILGAILGVAGIGIGIGMLISRRKNKRKAKTNAQS